MLVTRAPYDTTFGAGVCAVIIGEGKEARRLTEIPGKAAEPFVVIRQTTYQAETAWSILPKRPVGYEMLPSAVESFVLILEKIEVMLCPIVVSTNTAAAPISTNNNEYSTMSCPRSSLTKLFTKFLIIYIPPK